MKHTIELDGAAVTFESSENDAETVGRIAADLIGMRGFVNLDAEDIADVLGGARVIAVGEGTASGEDKVKAAALEAMRNTPGISGAKSIIAEVVSGFETYLAELSDVAFTIEMNCGETVNIVWGHVLDGDMDDSVRVNIIAIA
ncbi:MAG: hypothetical protein IJG37_00720 [Synergistaceae bacterium]|nr:hypothetical protein [Synergistaceae bacterium]MBQ7170498.1 hypothetical protein [Synergistaceae bacterium]